MNPNKKTQGFIAVHLGAGQHSLALKEMYQKLGREACRKGIESLQSSNNVLDAVVSATIVLEDSPLTNAGFGSNLNYDGFVECDASVMEGEFLNYGAVGAISDVKNPIQVAQLLCKHQNTDIGHGRIPPSFLVGSGAVKWAKEMDIPIVSSSNLISEKALKIHKHYKRKVEKDNCDDKKNCKKRLDTVGAVCVDENGNIAASCSSGGIILKFPGRVGQAAVWGCGVWASTEKVSIGCSTTGTGEHLVRTTLARTIAESLTTEECPIESLHASMQNNFIESKYLKGISEKLGGVLAIKYCKDDGIGDILWSHSTHSMIVSYMNSIGNLAESQMSTLADQDVGKKALVQGVCFKLKNTSR